MKQDLVYTPKAVMLITKIKRKLATQGVKERLDSWDYEELCSLCDELEKDAELQECLHLLEHEVTHTPSPNSWAM